MKELTEIVEAFDRAAAEGIRTALATVVQVEGSSYRRPGARMLVTSNGELTGAISGGCLEGDALRKARLVIEQQQPRLVTYDTTDEDDARLGIQLGCNGIIHILFEPVNVQQPQNCISLLRQVVRLREPLVLVTCFSLSDKKSAQQGTCLVLGQTGPLMQHDQQGAITGSLISDAHSALKQGKSVYHEYSNEQLSAFFEVIEPAITLLICGAGNDVIPLADMAHIMGWPVLIADGRPGLLTTSRFPHAAQLVQTKPEQLLQIVSPDKRTAVLLMTHNYKYDLAVLEQLLPLGLPYIGSLGPRKKLERMLTGLQQNGVAVADHVHTVYGPAGLDIGAETSEEIALAILSEIRAVFSGRSGRFLRDKRSPIHDEDRGVNATAQK